MNKQIQDLSYDSLLFCDIETSRQVEELTENHPHYEVWRYKNRNKDTQELPTHEETVKSYKDKAALFPEFGKIVCISIGYINGEEIVTKSFVGEEVDILREAVKAIKGTGRMLVYHNSAFDVPFIRKRWFINGLPYQDFIKSDSGLKPWDAEKMLIDTMILWKGFSFTNTSLDELAMCFNIPSSKSGEVTGANVGDAYFAGKIDAIAEYCEKDVAVLGNIIRKWKGDGLLEHVSKSGQKTEEVDQTLLQELYNTKNFSTDFQERLKKQLKERKMLKKEIKTVEKLLLSHYLDKVEITSFNKKEIETSNKEREKEIKEFIKTL